MGGSIKKLWPIFFKKLPETCEMGEVSLKGPYIDPYKEGEHFQVHTSLKRTFLGAFSKA